MDFLIILVVIVGVVVFWLLRVYNKLQAMMQDIREQLSNLQAALKAKIDLVGQIVEIAQSYGDHEKSAFLTASQNHDSYKNLSALSQSFPALRANETYQTLMHKLEHIEATLLKRRENYNAVVKNYNTARNRFPAVLIAQKLSFGIAPYFEIEDPDFAERVKMFQRDDSEAIQKLVQNSSKAIADKAQDAQNLIRKKVDDRQMSYESKDLDSEK